MTWRANNSRKRTEIDGLVWIPDGPSATNSNGFGPTGPIGVTGITGVTGPTGPTGPIGLTPLINSGMLICYGDTYLDVTNPQLILLAEQPSFTITLNIGNVLYLNSSVSINAESDEGIVPNNTVIFYIINNVYGNSSTYQSGSEPGLLAYTLNVSQIYTVSNDNTPVTIGLAINSNVELSILQNPITGITSTNGTYLNYIVL